VIALLDMVIIGRYRLLPDAMTLFSRVGPDNAIHVVMDDQRTRVGSPLVDRKVGMPRHSASPVFLSRYIQELRVCLFTFCSFG
jgi:hypothetical protein